MTNLIKTLGCVGLVLGLAVGCATVSDSPEKATFRNAKGIIGGSAFTGLPAVGVMTSDGHAHCTATVIGPRKVLTAAHCVYKVDPASIKFNIASSVSPKTNVIQKTIDIARAIPHPNYAGDYHANDVALLILAEDAGVQPMGLVSSVDQTLVGKELFFVGFGMVDANNQDDLGEKRSVWMKVSQVDATTFSYAETNKSACHGDSGGPAFVRDASGNYLIAGTTSGPSDLAQADCDGNGFQTRVDAFRDFIDNGDNTSCAETCATTASENRCETRTDGSFWQCDGKCAYRVPDCCVHTCDEAQASPGQCVTSNNGETWKCEGTCLVKVDSCAGGGGTNPVNPGTPGDPGACQYGACTDAGVTNGQCATADDGTTWRCDGTCMVYDPGCTGGGGTTPSNPGGNCQYGTCTEAGVSSGQCATADDGTTWRCDGTCMKYDPACTSGGTTPSNPGSCQYYACSEAGISSGQCAEDDSGSLWRCNGSCLVPDPSCNSSGSNTNPGNSTCQYYSCAEAGTANGQCATADDGSTWRCQGNCLFPDPMCGW